MTGIAIENEPWLLPPVDDLGPYLRHLTACQDNFPAFATALSGLLAHRLDFTDMHGLDRRLQRSGLPLHDLPGLQAFHLGIVSNTTQALALAPLRIAALRRGLALTLTEMPVDQVLLAVNDDDSQLPPLSGCDAILVALDRRLLPFWPAAGVAGDIGDTFDHVVRVCEALGDRTRAQIIVQNLSQEPGPYYGSFDAVAADAPRARVDRFNNRLADWAPGAGALLLDVATLAAQVGLGRWHDPVHWLTSRIAVAPDLLPFWADHMARLLAASRGLSRRCLILDLDNTLWGGVLGDDGPDGIRMAEGDGVGEAFRCVQGLARDLARRGVLLAVSSKNDPDAATGIFRSHPDMILREEDIAVFCAGWSDKAEQIGEIARQLGWPAASFVFLDDNPAERKRVREAFPGIAVPELPEDPAHYATVLAAAGYFDAVSVSAEDRDRGRFYRERARQAAAMVGTPAIDHDTYLRSLQMRLTVAPFDATGRARIVQLINKSNQFNLTTRRYGERDVRGMAADPAVVTFQLRLTDIFGDNGIIGVVICREAGGCWDIDTWIMSCRVLHRRLEEATLSALGQVARARGIRHITGTYIPSARNGLVAAHYPRLGFRPLADEGASDPGAGRFEMAVTQASPANPPSEIMLDLATFE